MNDRGPLLQLQGVHKSYPLAGGALPVLRGIDLAVQAGERVAVVGPSGSGKSTLLNLMGSLDQPTKGRVLLGGRDLESLSEEDLAEVRNRDIGFVFQQHHLLPQCSLLENVLIPALARGPMAEPTRQHARSLLDRAGLRERQDHRPGQLSGGECQRAAVVRALVNRPPLLLADEPTGALDGATAAGLIDLLVQLNREEGVALVVVTHARELADRMDRVYELREGLLTRG
jgi:ABC-type lipoprotein export system ATPase subunit